MIRIQQPPDYGTPPKDYDQTYFLTLQKQLQRLNDQIFTPGQGVEGTMQILQPARSGYGLKVGMTWVDGSNFVKWIDGTETFAPSIAAKFKVGRATAV